MAQIAGSKNNRWSVMPKQSKFRWWKKDPDCCLIESLSVCSLICPTILSASKSSPTRWLCNWAQLRVYIWLSTCTITLCVYVWVFVTIKLRFYCCSYTWNLMTEYFATNWNPYAGFFTYASKNVLETSLGRGHWDGKKPRHGKFLR